MSETTNPSPWVDPSEVGKSIPEGSVVEVRDAEGDVWTGYARAKGLTVYRDAGIADGWWEGDEIRLVTLPTVTEPTVSREDMEAVLARAAEVLWSAESPDGLRAITRPDCTLLAQALADAGLLAAPGQPTACVTAEQATAAVKAAPTLHTLEDVAAEFGVDLDEPEPESLRIVRTGDSKTEGPAVLDLVGDGIREALAYAGVPGVSGADEAIPRSHPEPGWVPWPDEVPVSDPRCHGITALAKPVGEGVYSLFLRPDDARRLADEHAPEPASADDLPGEPVEPGDLRAGDRVVFVWASERITCTLVSDQGSPILRSDAPHWCGYYPPVAYRREWCDGVSDVRLIERALREDEPDSPTRAQASAWRKITQHPSVAYVRTGGPRSYLDNVLDRLTELQEAEAERDALRERLFVLREDIVNGRQLSASEAAFGGWLIARDDERAAKGER